MFIRAFNCFRTALRLTPDVLRPSSYAFVIESFVGILSLIIVVVTIKISSISIFPHVSVEGLVICIKSLVSQSKYSIGIRRVQANLFGFLVRN